MNSQLKETLKKHYKLIIILTIEFIAFAVLLLLVFLAGKKTYTITFDLNGGTLLSGETTQRIVQGQSATPPQVAKDGHYLLRWSGTYNKVTRDSTVKAIWEYETTTGIEYDESKTATYCEIIGCYPYVSGDVYIGAYYDGKKIFSIRDGAFEGCERITAIYMLDGVLDIGERAFAECISLEAIELPPSAIFLGDEAFSGCVALSSILMPTDLENIGAYAFKNCEALEEITIPESVKSIGAGAFAGCKSLKKITLPESLEFIGDGAFSGCEALEEITIPSSVKTIGKECFKDCTSLESFTIPAELEEIGEYAFSGCTALTEIDIPESVQRIGVGVFDTEGMVINLHLSAAEAPEGFIDGWYTEGITVILVQDPIDDSKEIEDNKDSTEAPESEV